MPRMRKKDLVASAAKHSDKVHARILGQSKRIGASLRGQSARLRASLRGLSKRDRLEARIIGTAVAIEIEAMGRLPGAGFPDTEAGRAMRKAVRAWMKLGLKGWT